MRLNRRTVLKTTGAAAAAAALPASAAGAKPASETLDDDLDTDGGLQEVLVVFTDNDKVELLDQFDLAEGYHKFEVLPIGFTRATGEQLQGIARLDPVRYVEPNRELEYHNDDARAVTGVDDVQAGDGVPRAFEGEFGHTVVIDTGVAGNHPDLQSNLQHNYQYTNPQNDTAMMWVDTESGEVAGVEGGDTDTVGHGTHCSGSVAGDGTASNGQLRGMAPEADLTVYGAGATLLVAKAVAAYDHMLANHADEVQVVSNSYGISSSAPFNPGGALEVATYEAFKEDILPVFSAGNSGPGTNTLNDYAKAPYVLSVAATDDGRKYDGDGAENDPPAVTGFSSRGRAPGYDSEAAGAGAPHQLKEDANYDRATALSNFRDYVESGQNAIEDDEPVRQGSKTGTCGPGVHDPAAGSGVSYENRGYVKFEAGDDETYLTAAITWQPKGQDIDVNLRKGSKDGPKVATAASLQQTEHIESRLTPGETYYFELIPYQAVQAQVTVDFEVYDTSNTASGPFGLYRNGVGAPGQAVVSTIMPNDALKPLGPASYGGDPMESGAYYGTMSGTSMSCPVTAGIATLVNSAYRRRFGEYPDAKEVLAHVEATARDLSASYTKANIGAGFVDAETAVSKAWMGDIKTLSEIEPVSNADNPVSLSVTGTRTDDGDVYTAGDTTRMDVTVGSSADDEDPTHEVTRARDVIPPEWDVEKVDGDDVDWDRAGGAVVEEDGLKYVYFEGDVAAGGSETFTYFVSAPSSSGQYAFGPAQARSDEDDANERTGFVSVSGTSDTNYVVGASDETPL